MSLRLCFVVAFVVSLLGGCSPVDARVVDLERLVVDFVEAVPGRGSEAMELPTESESSRFIEAVRAARSGWPARADELVDPLNYRVRTVRDSATGRTVYLFEERRVGDGSWPHGWGMYVVAPRAVRPVVVEVPHPVFDVGTARIGVAAFRRAGAAALLVAGTHRYANRDGSSDAAQEDRTMFARVNRALVSRGDVVLQPHGFDSGSHDGDSDISKADAVVSGGESPPSALIQDVASGLRSIGLEVCVYEENNCAALGGTRNVQGIWCRAVGASFLHLELSRAVRDDRERWVQVVTSVVDSIASRDSASHQPER
jgi:hypothetical protein